jgi:hypothetical protein
MAGKSIEQRLESVTVQIKQKEAEKRNLMQRLKEEQRKERTRRLVQIGAIMARLGVDTVAKAQALQLQVKDRPEVKTWMAQVIASAGNGANQ